MNRLRNLGLCVAVALMIACSTRLLDGKPEYTKNEKTACVTCHVKNGSKELNEKGTYYKTNKSLPPK